MHYYAQGFSLTVFLMGDALGVSRPALAELLPAAETGLMRGIIKRSDKSEDGEP